MEVQDLMKPRYKVIGLWPGCGKLTINTVLSPDGQLTKFDEYPHLFRKLSWWEERDIADMPEYVTDGEQVYKVSEWDGTGSPYVFIDDLIHKGFRKGCGTTPIYGVLPAPSPEFNSSEK